MIDNELCVYYETIVNRFLDKIEKTKNNLCII